MVAAAEMLKLDPQEKLDFSKPQEWPEWRFRSVTKLNAEDEILPINLFTPWVKKRITH